MSTEKITGIILAGGQNSRMKKDKGLLKVGGKKIIHRIIEAIKPNVDEIMIISNGNNYDQLGYKVFSDIIIGCGPMSGIHTALSFTKTEKNLIVACDMPYLSRTVLHEIVESSGDAEVTVPEILGEPQPLCAVYSTFCLNRFSRLLAMGQWKMKDALSFFEIKKIPFHENYFANINTPEEYQNLKTTNYDYTS